MDPNTALTEIRRIASSLNDREEYPPEQVTRLLELVGGLDGWLTGGGFLPTAWERKR